MPMVGESPRDQHLITIYIEFYPISSPKHKTAFYQAF